MDASGSTMNVVQSNEIECEYCHGGSRSDRFAVLTTDQYALMREVKVYDRNDWFCVPCLIRINRKLERRRRKGFSKSGRSPHGTTGGTTNALDANEIEPNPTDTDTAQRRRLERDGRRQASIAQPTSSQNVSNRSNFSQRSPTGGAEMVQNYPNEPQSGPSNQNNAPAQRQFAVKSTGGRIGLRRPQQNVSVRQPSTPGQNTSTRSTVNSPKPGPSDTRPNKSLVENLPADSSSSEMMPPYNSPSSNSVVQSVSPNVSIPHASSNASLNSNAVSPAGSIGAPIAPMPRNRPVRNKAPHAIPRRRGESDAQFRARQKDAHNQFQRGGSG